MNYNLFKTLLLAMLMLCSFAIQAKEVNVVITTDDGFDNSNGIIEIMQQNLSKLLSEINTANDENRELNLAGFDIKVAALKNMEKAWKYVHFYCKDVEVIDRCWPLKNGYMLRHIPFTINSKRGQYGLGTYQECVVEFDKRGQITDFCFVFDTQLSESMQHCGTMVELERKIQIMKLLNSFRTAFYTRDTELLQKIFLKDWLSIHIGLNNTQFVYNLLHVFNQAGYIDVKFSEIGENSEDSGCGIVTRSASDKNMYGVRFRLEWKSDNYSDAGYVFLLWDFANEDVPIIHLCTWQPEYTNGVKLPEEDIYSLSDFDL